MATKKKLLQAAAGSAGGAGLNVEEVFSTYLVKGTGSAYTVNNGIDLSGEGGLVWIKGRSSSGYNHTLYDTERSGTLFSDATNAASDYASEIASYNNNGFTTVSSGAAYNNVNNTDYASWTFRKAPKFFDVVTYTGTGVARTVSHNLDSEVGSIFIKRTDTTQNWAVYHRGANGGTNPEDYYFRLNQDIAQVNDTNQFNSTPPTSTEFYLGTDGDTNASGSTYVAYLFAHNDGDGDFGPDGDADIIKCGSYTGNDGAQTIDLGFEAQWVMIKNASNTNNWAIFDVMRSFTHSTDVSGPDSSVLYPNLSNAETGVARIFPTANGFGFVAEAGGTVNSNGQTYIYTAIRRGPMAVPEDADDVFDINYRDTTKPHFNSTSSVVDMAFKIYTLSGYGDSWKKYIQSRLTGTKHLQTNSTGTQGSNNENTWDHHNGWSEDPGSSDYFSLMWKRAPSFFDVVAYTGNGTAGRTVSHNLGVAPEMIWVKGRNLSSQDWAVYHSATGTSKYLKLNETNAALGIGRITGTSDTTFTLDSDDIVNKSGDPYIAYLFASVDGVSKVGSYTGTGAAQNIDCGFSNGARFILIKRTDSTGGWQIWDSERGIVTGNDPRLNLNDTSSPDSYDFVDPYSAGFSVTTDTAVNTSGASYIFYAIA